MNKRPSFNSCSRRSVLLLTATTGMSLLPNRCRAIESKNAVDVNRLTYVKPDKQLWHVGVKVMTTGSSCKELYATFPVPTDWPEQTVQVVDQDVSRYVADWDTRDIMGGVKQVRVRMVNIPPNTSSDVVLTYEVTKSCIVGADKTDDLVIPRAISRQNKLFMGNSPYIDPRHPQIKKIATQLRDEAGDSAWSHVEGIYDWVRDNIEYREGSIKAATKALSDGYGDCEELTSLFVSICRASKIPSRMVWIPGHCYPEFLLHDAEGNDHWFPCQAAGTRQFGEMDEYKPILQKGDRFKVPEKKTPQRYVAEFCKVTGTKTRPKVDFVRELSSSD